MPNDCTVGISGVLCAFPLPLKCSVIVVIFLLFDTFYTVHLRSAPVYSPERLKSSLTPCPLNTAPVKEKHRRVVWYLLLLADTDRPFNCLLNVNNQLLSIIIATVTHLALNGVLHSLLRAHGARQSLQHLTESPKFFRLKIRFRFPLFASRI